MHCWVVGTIAEGNQVQGVLFESKQGRFAVKARAVIDCTGDGDVFAQAGAAFDDDVDSESAHARMTTSFRFGNVEMRRYLDFRMLYAEEYKEAMRKASQEGLSLLAHATPYESVALFLTPKMSGYSALNVADLTKVEFTCRDIARKGLEFYRKHVPGFERAWILDTASQIGTRHARRLIGAERITIEHWRSSGLYRDSIGLCPGVTEKFPTLQIPYGCLVPRDVEGVLAAGRNLSADTKSHAALREIPECWVMGEAAGVAAAMTVSSGNRLRDVSVPELQRRLLQRGAIIEPPGGVPERVADDVDTQLEASIHWRAVDDVRAHDEEAPRAATRVARGDSAQLRREAEVGHVRVELHARDIDQHGVRAVAGDGNDHVEQLLRVELFGQRAPRLVRHDVLLEDLVGGTEQRRFQRTATALPGPARMRATSASVRPTPTAHAVVRGIFLYSDRHSTPMRISSNSRYFGGSAFELLTCVFMPPRMRSAGGLRLNVRKSSHARHVRPEVPRAGSAARDPPAGS